MKKLVAQNHNFWAERIQKETSIRSTWTTRYGHKYLKDPTGIRKPSQQTPFRSALGVDPVSAARYPVSKKAQVRQPEPWEIQDQLYKSDSGQVLPHGTDRVRQAKGAPQEAKGRSESLDMRQVPPDTLKLLFQGISFEGKGRAQYLQKRYQQMPEEKFPYPIVSSWEYGWHVGEVMKNYRTPTYARVYPITKSFYNKNGVFHYPRRSDQLLM